TFSNEDTPTQSRIESLKSKRKGPTGGWVERARCSIPSYPKSEMDGGRSGEGRKRKTSRASELRTAFFSSIQRATPSTLLRALRASTELSRMSNLDHRARSAPPLK